MDQSFLSLGDMITFIGLIVAVYQLAKPRYVLIWKLSSKLLKSLAIILLIAGYLSPLIAIITPDIKNLNIFWATLSLGQLLQVVGFLLITFGSLVVAYIYSRFNRSHLLTVLPKFKPTMHKYPKKNWRVFNFQLERSKFVTTRSAKKFYRITSVYLVRGHVEEVVEVIHYNLKSLISSAQQYSPDRFRVDDDAERKPAKQNGSNYTFETLYQILTDDIAMKHVCTSNRPFLHAIVWADSNYNGWHRNELSSILHSSIVKHLAINHGSYLYTQKDTHNGSARFANIYDLLTDDEVVKRQHIIPGQLTWNVSKSDVPLDEYAEALFQLAERMIDSYKRQPNGELLSNIRAILDQLFGSMSGVSRILAFDKDIPKSVTTNFLIKLNTAMHTGLLFKDDDPDNFKTNDAEIKSKNEQHTFDQKTLTGLLAHKVYDLIEDLIVLFRDTTDPDDELRRTIYSFVRLHVETPVAQRYEELLWERLFDKAVEGKLEIASNIQGFHPNVLRFMIGWLAPNGSFLDKVGADARNRLMGIMANELKDVLLNDKKMSNDEPMIDVLLPQNVKAVPNKKNKTVKYYRVDEKGKRKLIDLKAKTTVASASDIAKKPRKRK